MILKSKYDGIGNRLPIDIVFALDKSGSMESRLGQSYLTCIELAQNAVLNLITQLESNDSFGLIVFDNQAATIIPLQTVDALKSIDYKSIINVIRAEVALCLSMGILKHLSISTALK